MEILCRISEPEIKELDLTGLLASADEDEYEDEHKEDVVDQLKDEGDDVSSTVSARERAAEKYRVGT